MKLSKLQQLSQPLRLRAADGDFRVLAVGHTELVGAFEPGDNFFDVVDIDQVGAVDPPEKRRVQIGLKFLDGPVIGLAFQVLAHQRDEAILNGREDEIVGVQQEQPVGAAHQQFALLRRSSFQRAQKLFQKFMNLYQHVTYLI